MNYKEYQKQYREKNKEKLKELNKQYYEKNKKSICEKQKQYAKQNKEKIRIKDKKYREKNKESIKEKDNIYYGKNKENILLLDKIWRQKNKIKLALYMKKYDKKYRQKNKIRNNEYLKKYNKQRRKVDINFRIVDCLRSRLNTALKNNSTSKHTKELLGCSIDNFKKHLESQFQEGMTFNNYGKWHIDHIKPCCSFDMSIPEEQHKCFHYSNLQPLWAKDNLKKGARI